MITVVDTAELRRRAGLHQDLVFECGPSLAADVLSELFDVPQAVVGILSSGTLYFTYLRQVASVPLDAGAATLRASGQALELHGTALAYEAVEEGNPLAAAGGWALSGGGRLLNGAGETWDIVANGVDVRTVTIPQRSLDLGPRSTTTEMISASGNVKAFSVGAEVKLITETFDNGMVRVTLELQVDGGVGAKRLLKALGLEGGLTAGGTLYWDLPDAASADRFKHALGIILAGGVMAGPFGAALAGAAVRLPQPSGGSLRAGAYLEGQGDAGPVEVEGRGQLTGEAGFEGSEFQQAIDLELEAEGELDLPFLPAELSAGGSIDARLEFEDGGPSRLEVVVRGKFEADASIGGLEAGRGSIYEARLVVELGPIRSAIDSEIRALLADPSAADDAVRHILQRGADSTTAVLNVYTSSEVEADADLVFVEGEYQRSTEERVGQTILHEAAR